MKQEILIQIIALIVLAVLAIFYNPANASSDGKMLFFGIILATVLFLIVFDLYKKIDSNSLKIKLFEEKLDLRKRLQ